MIESGNLAYFRLGGDRAMAKSRHVRTAVASRSGKPDIAAVRDKITAAVFDMEEPLREAQHLVHVLSAISQYRGEDNEAVSSVAAEANRKLDIVHGKLHRLFTALRRAS
jgi:hypothetical protein